MKELGEKEITPAFLRSCFKICHDAYSHLQKALDDRVKDT
jgi:hypothetical protein